MITQVAKRNTGLGNNAEHAQSISDKALDSYTLHGSQAARKLSVRFLAMAATLRWSRYARMSYLALSARY